MELGGRLENWWRHHFIGTKTERIEPFSISNRERLVELFLLTLTESTVTYSVSVVWLWARLRLRNEKSSDCGECFGPRTYWCFLFSYFPYLFALFIRLRIRMCCVERLYVCISVANSDFVVVSGFESCIWINFIFLYASFLSMAFHTTRFTVLCHVRMNVLCFDASFEYFYMHEKMMNAAPFHWITVFGMLNSVLLCHVSGTDNSHYLKQNWMIIQLLLFLFVFPFSIVQKVISFSCAAKMGRQTEPFLK